MSAERPAHERLLGIRVDQEVVCCAVCDGLWVTRIPGGSVTARISEDELLAAADSLRALVFAARKERA